MSDALTIGMTAVSTLTQAAGSISAGQSASAASRFQAAQLEREARAAEAEASQRAYEEARQKRLKLSRARLVGGASGSDRAFDLEGEIEAEGRYNTLMALFEGSEVAAGRRTQAAAKRYDASVARRAGWMQAGSHVVSGGASLFAKYGNMGSTSMAPQTSIRPRKRPA